MITQENTSNEGASTQTVSYAGAKRFSTPAKARQTDTTSGANPNEYTDSFQLGPFKIYSREASPKILELDAGFTDHALKKLGLLERAEREVRRDERNGVIDPVLEDEREEVVYEHAVQLLNSEAYKIGPKGVENDRLYKALVTERYERVIFGLSDDPDDWGGLVAWSGGPVASDDPDTLRVVMKLPFKLELYQRFAALGSYGMKDELFRRALGRGRR